MTRLTAEQLGLTQPVYDALIWTRNALDPQIPDTELPSWLRFNMHQWGGADMLEPGEVLEPHACGTACCIGGTMEMYLAGLHTKPTGYTVARADIEAYEATEIQAMCDMAKKENVDRAEAFGPFNALFFEYEASKAYDRELAVEAIDAFLAGNTSNPWNQDYLKTA